MSLAEGRGTREPYLARIMIAQRINKAMGGAMIAPWELDELPEDWLDALMGMGTDLSNYRSGKAKVEEIFAKWRNKHFAEYKN